MKICVILTGGTIGSKCENNIINVNETSHFSLISLYEKKYGKDVEFQIQSPLTILSENLLPSHWEILSNVIRSINQKEYDGIIITHGSDTLPYTSAMVGLLFGQSSIPIILVASNYELENPLSNGLANFRNAVCFIKEGKTKGVFTIFQNHNQENIVYLSTRLQEADNFLDQFSSFGGVDFGKIQKEQFIPIESVINPSIEEQGIKEQGIPKCGIVDSTIHYKNQVLIIKPYPGFDYNTVNITKNTKAILHGTYHSATTCTEGINTSILSFIEKCQQQNIDVYISSFKENTLELYDTSNKVMERGGIPLVNISSVASFVKLMIAYNQNVIPPREYMKNNIYHESIIKKV